MAGISCKLSYLSIQMILLKKLPPCILCNNNQSMEGIVYLVQYRCVILYYTPVQYNTGILYFIIPRYTTGILYFIIPQYNTGLLYFIIPQYNTGVLYFIIPEYNTGILYFITPLIINYVSLHFILD